MRSSSTTADDKKGREPSATTTSITTMLSSSLVMSSATATSTQSKSSKLLLSQEAVEVVGDNNVHVVAANSYFKKLIDLVPPKAYFDAESNEILANHNVVSKLTSSSAANTIRSSTVTATANKNSLVGGSKHDKYAKHQAKKAKLNPAQLAKTSELQQVLPDLKGKLCMTPAYEADVPKTAPLNTENHSVPKSERLANSDVDDMVNGHEENASAEAVTSSSSEASKRSTSATVTTKLQPEQLREKLRARIEELRLKRRKGMTPEEFLESKKLRRKESKLKLKQKRKEAKKLKLSIQKQAKNNQQKMNGVSEVEPSNDEKPGVNSVVFSKFEFSEQAKKPKDRKTKKPKSYKELYEKVTRDKAQLNELKEADPEKAKKIEEKAAWRKAMEQSKGVKVKDNPDLIKKSMKKEEKLKQRSKKKWDERTAAVAEQQQKRQEKRKKNILSKKQSKVDRKIKLAKKKGRLVSGF